MKTGILAAAISSLLAAGAFSQTLPEFEVASVKPAQPLAGRSPRPTGLLRGGPGTDDPGRAEWTNTTLRVMLMNAFDVKDYQVQGPEWLATERFDISAKVPANITKEQFGLMIQKLLAGRFQMTYHHESREQAVYALVVAKGGSKLKAPDANDAGGGPGAMAVMGGGHLQARKIVAAGIASMLSTFVDRPVIDETGLTGFYQFTLNWAPEGASDASSGPTIYAAIQQELGLRLEPRKMLLDHVIIDHIEKVPTAN